MIQVCEMSFILWFFDMFSTYIKSFSQCASVGCWDDLFVAHERNWAELFSADVFSPWHCFRKKSKTDPSLWLAVYKLID